MQEFDWQAIKADMGKMESGKAESNDDHLCHSILQPMERLLEASNIMPTKFERTQKKRYPFAPT
jgi:hypothetical protein